MRPIKTGQLALTYVGIFLGAGFVSGQELWQFFACFGLWGFPGFLLTAAIFFLIFYALLELVWTTGEERVGYLLSWGNHPWLRALVDGMQALFLFGIAVIMAAGAGALCTQLTGVPTPLAAAVFSLAVLLTALLGLRGLIAAFSALVPVITLCAVVLGVAVFARSGWQPAPAAGSVSPLLPSWPVGSLTYAAYNIFGTIGILIPLGKLLPDRGVLARGLGLGSGLLVALAGSIIAALAARPDAGSSELPMMALAGELHPAFALLYGLLMLLAMFAAALGSLVALLVQLELQWPSLATRRLPVTAGLTALAYLGSLWGFGSLIGTVYPLFGYASIPLLACLLVNWRRKTK